MSDLVTPPRTLCILRLSAIGDVTHVVAIVRTLQQAWPEELADLKWQVMDAPSIRDESQTVRRWATKKAEMTICIFRVPIERLGHARRADPMHERMHIEEYVFAAVAHLLDKEPWELVPERYRPE